MNLIDIGLLLRRELVPGLQTHNRLLILTGDFAGQEDGLKQVLKIGGSR